MAAVSTSKASFVAMILKNNSDVTLVREHDSIAYAAAILISCLACHSTPSNVKPEPCRLGADRGWRIPEAQWCLVYLGMGV